MYSLPLALRIYDVFPTYRMVDDVFRSSIPRTLYGIFTYPQVNIYDVFHSPPNVYKLCVPLPFPKYGIWCITFLSRTLSNVSKYPWYTVYDLFPLPYILYIHSLTLTHVHYMMYSLSLHYVRYMTWSSPLHHVRYMMYSLTLTHIYYMMHSITHLNALYMMYSFTLPI